MRAVVASGLLLFAGAAAAQNLIVTVPATLGTPPVANAVTRGRASSITFNANNVRAGTTLRSFQVRLPGGYVVTGGQGPAGWTVTGITGTQRTITFQVTNCAVGGIAFNATGAFRVDTTAPNTAIASDQTDNLTNVVGADLPSCSATTGWNETAPANITWERKTLLVTGSVSPGQGASPLAATATYTVTNLSSGTRTITPSSAVSPGSGWTSTPCSPVNASVLSGASTNFTCGYTLNGAGAYTFAGGATGTNGTSAVGAVVGTVEVGSATATFAFDALVAGVGDQVRATLTVYNQGATTITATPPTFAQLVLQNVARASGTTDPAPASIPGGGSASFVYLLDVTGAVGASYVAQGTATFTDGVVNGSTNLAVTPPGTVSASRVEWTPPAFVVNRGTLPYTFTVTVTNGSASAVTQVRVVNPQNPTWTGMAPVSVSGLNFSSNTLNGTTRTLSYTGSLASGGTATIRFSFTGVPSVTQTTSYPFQVLVNQGASLVTTYSLSAYVAVPIPDVDKLSIASGAGGQVLAWVNTSSAGAVHDGVVVFKRAAPGVPFTPADFVDYSVPANRPADFFYEDGEGSVTDTIADPAVGAFNYRVCNRDSLFVYSNCNSGFWSGAGWLNSATAPTSGWTHQLAAIAINTMPGVVPGSRAGVAATGALATLDATSGDRIADPVTLAGSPWSNSPILPLADGRNVLFTAADPGTGNGQVTAVDVATGAAIWQVTVTGETFVAGVSTILRQYASTAFQAAYTHDLLLLPSTTGRVLGLDATTGATLWNFDTGTAVRAGTWYDAVTNRLFVATDGGGVLAYDFATSNPTTPPTPVASGYTNPGGTFRLACGRAPISTDFACIDVNGNLSVLDKVSGAVRATVPTGATSPTGLLRTTAALAGFVVTSAGRVVRVLAPGSPPALSVAGFWAPGLTLSPANALPIDGLILVVASDRQIHRLSLATAADIGPSIAIPPEQASVTFASPTMDTSSNRLLFGSSNGRLWVVPF